MTIASLFNLTPDPRSFSLFTFANADHHALVRGAIQTQKGVMLTAYVMDPTADFDLQNFLRRHQQSHFDNNSVLNLPSNDLSDLNLKDQKKVDAWALLHAQEHINWAASVRVF